MTACVHLPPLHHALCTQNMLQQKQMLYKKVAEAERNPFFLHPHQVTPIYPFIPFSPAGAATVTPSNSTVTKLSPIYPLVQPSPPNTNLTILNTGLTGSAVLTPPSSVSTSSAVTTQANSATTNLVSTSVPTTSTGGVLPTAGMAAPSTPPRPPYTAQLYAPFMKYPLSPPTPSGISTLSVLSPWNIAAMSQIGVPVDPNGPSKSSNPGGKTEASNSTSTRTLHGTSTSSANAWNPASSSNGSSAPVLPQHILSPHPNFTSIQSPLSYIHASPLSPMMLIQSPYASSASSCPSVSSSSGCSSDSATSFTGLQRKTYAPSEYHVGPRQPLSEKLTERDSVSEGANSSGRNTPVDNLEDEEANATPNQSATVLTGPVGSEVPSFTPFIITSQGPSIAQPSTPHTLMVGGNRSTNSTRRDANVHDTHKNTTVVDLTCQAVSYPYSVESAGHSAQPMSVDSSTHVSGTVYMYMYRFVWVSG